jgi:hypothetical protein
MRPRIPACCRAALLRHRATKLSKETPGLAGVPFYDPLKRHEAHVGPGGKLKTMQRLAPAKLDALGLRLEELAAEQEQIREQIKEQIENFGSIPPRAEKSKRVEGEQFRFTLSSSSRTEIRDADVERIKEACPKPLFSQLFIEVTKYKLAKTATMLLSATLPEDAPRNLRVMFQKAVQIVEDSPRLKIERVEVPA